MLTFLWLTGAALAADWPVDPVDAPWSTTSLGVEVQDVVVGSGDEAVDGATVAVHYRGLLADGSLFDASRERGQLFRMRLGSHEVIPGWEDGLVGMRVGGTRRMVIPSELGYGPRQAGPIPPDSTLYFEVELVAVQAPRLPPAALAEVAEGDWQEVRGARFADVRLGEGAVARSTHRVCLDFSVWRDGVIVEQTYGRRACTWYGPEDDDLPAALWTALNGAREGGARLIDTGDGAIYQVELAATHK